MMGFDGDGGLMGDLDVAQLAFMCVCQDRARWQARAEAYQREAEALQRERDALLDQIAANLVAASAAAPDEPRP